VHGSIGQHFQPGNLQELFAKLFVPFLRVSSSHPNNVHHNQRSESLPIGTKKKCITIEMPREFKPISWTTLKDEHIGQRFWIVPNDRLKLAGLTGKPVPEDKKKAILLLSGVYKGLTDYMVSPWVKRPIFAEFQNKEGAPVKKTAGTYPDETKHSYFLYEPVDIGALATAVKKENMVKALGVSANMLEEAEAEAGAGSAAPAPAPAPGFSREQRKSTDLLLDTLIQGENRQTVKQILDRKAKPDLSVVRQMPVSFVAATQLLPKGKKAGDMEKRGYSYSAGKGKPAQRVATEMNITMFKDCIGLLMDSNAFSQEQKQEYFQLLLERGANPSTSLTLAVANLNIPVAKMLLDAGADPNTVTKYFFKEEPFYTTPVKAVIPETMVKRSEDYEYSNVDVETQKKKWINMERVTALLLQPRDFVEQDGKLVLADPSPETITVEPFISLPMLQELQGRLAAHMQETERVRPILAGPYTYEQRMLVHISWYERHAEVLSGILHKLEEVSTRQRMAPGGNLAEQARRNAVAHGFRNETRNNRQSNAFLAYAERNANRNGSRMERTRKTRRHHRTK